MSADQPTQKQSPQTTNQTATAHSAFNPIDKPLKSWQDYALLYFKGMAMGGADIVPGVSGGTIALIAGIYERLVTAISRFSPSLIIDFWQTWQKDGLKTAILRTWQTVDGTFLVTLLSGIATSFVLFSGVIHFLLTHQPLLIWSFFFGLVLATGGLLLAEIKAWTIKRAILFLLGVVFIQGVLILPVATGEPSLPFLFLAGALAFCAMILPGISGSFVLLLLGAYDVVLRAVTEGRLSVLITVFCGMVAGVLSFSRLLSWLLDRYYQGTLAFLTGLVLGSAVKIYPFKIGEHNVLPWDYPQVFDWGAVLGLAILGAGIVFGLSWVGKRA